MNCFARWLFQIFFISIPTWGNDPIWLIFFRWVETTNQFGFLGSFFKMLLLCFCFLSEWKRTNPFREAWNLESVCPLFWGETHPQKQGPIEYPDTCFISSNLVLRVLYILNTNKKLYPPWKNEHVPWQMMLGSFVISFWNGPFSGFMLIVGVPLLKKTTPHFPLPKRCGRATSPIRSWTSRRLRHWLRWHSARRGEFWPSKHKVGETWKRETWLVSLHSPPEKWQKKPWVLLPWKLTWQWNIHIFNRKYIFKWSIFHCHGSLPESTRVLLML